MVVKIKAPRAGRYMKLDKRSDGYKQGLRYIDFGEYASSKTRFLRSKPKHLK